MRHLKLKLGNWLLNKLQKKYGYQKTEVYGIFPATITTTFKRGQTK